MSIKVRMKELKDGRKSLYLDYYLNGNRTTETLNLYMVPKNKAQNKEVKELAENIRAKREIELASNANNLPVKHRARTDFLVYFEKIAEIKVKSEGVRGGANYDNALYHLKNYTKGKLLPISQVDERFLEDFKEYLTTKMRQNSANNVYSKIKTVLRRAVKDCLIDKNPSENVKYFKAPETIRNFLTIEELCLLANTPCKHKHVKLAFLFSCYTGLRSSDIYLIKWEQVKDNRITLIQRKGQNANYIPVNSTVQSILSQVRGSEKLIPMPSSHIFKIPTPSHINKYIREWVKSAGVEKRITFHCGRHTFATLSITSGVDIYTVKEMLGHKDLHTTQIYAKIIDKKKELAVNALPAIGALA